VARVLSQNLLGNDHTAIKSIEAKFVGHVFPGETLKVSVWKDGEKRFFEAEVVERGKKAVTGLLMVREGAKL
jgi:acyl dehydratase